MSDPKAQSEPTMEEILASIRRIISENDEENEGQARDGQAHEGQGADKGDQAVLELTEMVAEDGSVVSLAGQPDEHVLEADAAVFSPDDGKNTEVAMPDAKDDTIEFSSVEEAPAPAASQASNDTAANNVAPNDSLLSDSAAAAATAAFAAMARSKATDDTGIAGNIPLGYGRTLEDLVQEMIRPMLKDWLDRNLPPMVERLVRKELERLARRAEE